MGQKKKGVLVDGDTAAVTRARRGGGSQQGRTQNEEHMRRENVQTRCCVGLPSFAVYPCHEKHAYRIIGRLGAVFNIIMRVAPSFSGGGFGCCFSPGMYTPGVCKKSVGKQVTGTFFGGIDHTKQPGLWWARRRVQAATKINGVL